MSSCWSCWRLRAEAESLSDISLLTTQILATSASKQMVSKYGVCAESLVDKATSFRHPSLYQIKPPAMLPCKNLLTPHLFLYVLMRVSQILVVPYSPSQPSGLESSSLTHLDIINTENLLNTEYNDSGQNIIYPTNPCLGRGASEIVFVKYCIHKNVNIFKGWCSKWFCNNFFSKITFWKSIQRLSQSPTASIAK